MGRRHRTHPSAFCRCSTCHAEMFPDEEHDADSDIDDLAVTPSDRFIELHNVDGLWSVWTYNPGWPSPTRIFHYGPDRLAASEVFLNLARHGTHRTRVDPPEPT